MRALFVSSMTIALSVFALSASAADTQGETVGNQADIPLNAPASTLKESDAQAFRQDDLGLEVQTLSDGSQMIDLQGRFQMAATAATDAEGHVHQNCLTEHDVTENGIPAPVVGAKRDER